jgi:tetratricopeptide (TPR) repeat protein
VAQDAHAEDAGFVPASLDLANCRFGLGQLGATSDLITDSVARLESSPPADIAPKAIADLLPQLKSRLAEFAGAWLAAADLRAPVRHSRVNFLDKKMPPWDASNAALAHDPARAVTIMQDAHMAIGGTEGGVEDGKAVRQFQSIGFAPSNFFVALNEERWADAAADLSVADATALHFGNVDEIRHRYVWPWLAYALARAGRADAARGLANAAPLDCYVCLQMRGRIAALRHDFAGAAGWYQRAIDSGSDLPFAYEDWAAALWTQGKPDDAIAKLQNAVDRAPQDADALELWGEILVATNRSDLALAKFEAANLSAPAWGRLHLKWGEALHYLGRRAEAQAQFASAAALYLTPSERAALARFRTGS